MSANGSASDLSGADTANGIPSDPQQTRGADVVDFVRYGRGRGLRLEAAAVHAERSQELYERVVARAHAARRRDFTAALGRGLSVDELAEAVCLEPEEVLFIVGRQ